jgi:antitoxin component YwqK of YwqJK toxin-antitoxin module
MNGSARALALLFLCATCLAQRDSHNQARMTRAEMLGFHGPIHTQNLQGQELSKDPRSQPKLHIRSEHKPWMVFSPSGQLVEEGDTGANGKRVVVHRTYDESGREVDTEIVSDKETKHIRSATTEGPTGTTETKTYNDDKLVSTIVNSRNEKGDGGEGKVFDSQGELTSYSRGRRDAASQSSEAWGAKGKFVSHVERRYGPDRDLVQVSRYDETGKLVSDLSFSKGKLTSFWQDPACACTNGAGFNMGDYTVSYNTEKDGKLYKEIQHHKGRRTNHEIDDQELRDESDRLLERIEYSYQRDSHGNWTKRTISVMDSATGAMVAIRQEDRELTYY